jgi:hypothetical protein
MLQAIPQSPENGQPKADPVLGERIAGGVAFDGRLWLRGLQGSIKRPSGGLVSLSLSDDSRVVHFEQGVLDIEKLDGDLWIMRCPKPQANEVVLSIWKKGRFEDRATFSLSRKEQALALVNGTSGPAVLSTRAIRILSTDKRAWHVTRLKGVLRGGFQYTAALPLSRDSVYIGFNSGEWGGGLQRIDLQTGLITNVERRDTKELCAGPLNSDCDPVTGAVSDSQNKECVLVAVGLDHMMSHGRILRVCGNDVDVVFQKSYEADGFKGPKLQMTKLQVTESFFGLVRGPGKVFWSITPRAFYRFEADGSERDEFVLPTPKPVSGIYLSRELPGVIVVSMDADWAASLSGYTPLLIPLEN